MEHRTGENNGLISLAGMVDSHFHALEMERKGLDVPSILGQCFSLGLVSGLEIATDERDWERRKALVKDFKTLYLSIGLSPACVSRPGWRKGLSSVEKIAADPMIAGIGEIGLDWYWNYGSREDQLELFESQLGIADRLELPVVIHNRDADEDILRVLSRINPGCGGVLHCFSASFEYAKKMIDLGFILSFAGNLTYKKSGGLREAARMIPLRYLLAETDAPYLAPQPVRGKINRPQYIGMIYQFIAGLRGISLEELTSTLSANFHRLFFRNR